MRKPSILMTLLFLISLAGCKIVCPAEPTTASTTVATTVCTTASDAEATADTTSATEPLSPVETYLEQMTLEEKVGQLFLARCPASGDIEAIQSYHLGGYILFNRDFENKDPQTIMDTIATYQSTAQIPMLIAVDEEGGTVTRVSCNSALRHERFFSPRYLYSQGGMDVIINAEQEKCALLRSLGINVNMAPVCDIAQDPAAFMYNRSLGQSPEITGQFAATVTSIMAQNNVGSVLKHFPGYGNNSDTHTGIAVDPRPLDALAANDLQPFAAGIEAQCDAILVSHLIVQCIDPTLPATLSPAVHTYLRDEMGFDGVIVTDDLVMDAVRAEYGVGEAAILAVLAGNDLLCVSEYAPQYDAIIHAIYTGRIPMTLVDDAVTRILLWKADLGLLNLNSSESR